MEIEDSSGSSSSVSMTIDPIPQNEMKTNFIRTRDRLEAFINTCKEFLEKPSENTNILLKQIAAAIKRSKEHWNSIDNVKLTEYSLSSSNNNSQMREKQEEEFRKFLDSLKGTVKSGTYLQDEGEDANLDAVLFNVNFILKSSNVSPLNQSEGLLLSPVKNVISHENQDILDSKRQKVTSDDEPNSNIVEFFKKEENPLENDVVLKTLFQFFAAADLFKIRLVSRKWNIIAIPLLKQRYHCILHYDKDTFVKKGSTSVTLSQLNSILTTSQNFPVINFSFVHGDLGSSEAKEFFKLHGENIFRIFLNLRNKGESSFPHTSISAFRKILVKYAKNIEWMELWDIPKEWCEKTSLELFPEPRNTIQLPRLTSIMLKKANFTTGKSHRLIQDIIQAAVNLKTIRGYKIEFLDPSASTFENKIHAVKDIRFEPTEENLDLYLKFAEGNPELEWMDISLDILNNINNNVQLKKKKAVEYLQMILESSKESFTTIANLPPLAYLPNLKFPPMCKMNYAHFSYQAGRTFKWVNNFQGIPRPLKLGQIFPNLQVARLDCVVPQASVEWLNFFDYSQPLDSVKVLKVLYEICPPYLEKLAALFPAVESLRVIMDVRDFHKTMSFIWKGFPNVKDLTLEIYKYRDGEVIKEQMDSGITGLSPETCIQLKNNLKNAKLEDVEALRENPWICDFKKLKSLSINFSFEVEGYAFSRPVFSTVAGIFGFDLAKKSNGVKVHISARPNNQIRKLDIALSQVVHYVNDVE